MKGMLIRVGIDLGYQTGGYLSPIFEDETSIFAVALISGFGLD